MKGKCGQRGNRRIWTRMRMLRWHQLEGVKGTYKGSGGPTRSNEVEEGLISSLMDMVDVSGET